MVLAALAGSLAVAAVNLPFRPTGGRAEPFMALGESLGRMAGALLGNAPQSLQVDVWGVDEGLHHPVTVAVLKGVLTPFLGEGVNYVNAERIAEGRGIEVVRSTHSNARSEYPQLVDITLSGGGRSVELGGTVFGDGDSRVVRFENYPLEFRPEGNLLVLENLDKPGVVGKVGTLLAEAERQHRRHPPLPPWPGGPRRPASRPGAHARAAGEARRAAGGEVGAAGAAGVGRIAPQGAKACSLGRQPQVGT